MKQTLWKELFDFSRQERIGIVVLMILTGLCYYVPATWESYNIPDANDSSFFMPVEKAAPHIATIRSATLFQFDPNTLAENDWIKLGVKPRTVQTIQNYLAKGGKFRKKEDLQRIYGLPLGEYKRLESYIRITKLASFPPGFVSRPFYPDTKTANPKKLSTIDINEADSATWESLNGIGPVLAGRIVRFRDKLGGFYAVSQIKETYGLPDSTFVKIQASLQLNKVSLKNLDINQLDEKSLAAHPYIRYKLARLIVLYRNNNGPFRQAQDLLGIPLVDDSIYRKLEPYIKTIN